MSSNDAEQTRILAEILKWIKFTGMNQVKAALEQQLTADADKIIYQNSDGKHGTVELGKIVGLSKDAVHNRWESWAKMGLGENIPVSGGTRFQRSFDLEDFGIKVPENRPKAQADQKQVAKEEAEVSE